MPPADFRATNSRPLTLAERQARARAKRAAEVAAMREALRQIAEEAKTIAEARRIASEACQIKNP